MVAYAVQLPEGNGGHIVTGAEATAGSATVVLNLNISKKGHTLKNWSAYASHDGYAFRFEIYHNQIANVVQEDHQVGDRRISWQGSVPIPASSTLRIVVSGPIAANDLIYAEAIIDA